MVNELLFQLKETSTKFIFIFFIFKILILNLWSTQCTICLVFTNLVYGFEGYGQQHHFFNETEELFLLEAHEHATSFLEGNGNPLLMGPTLIHNAATKGAGTTYKQYNTFLLLSSQH